ncbi:MAG: DNA-3-methyladenine glycosylase I [Acidimicrobiales bacterium]
MSDLVEGEDGRARCSWGASPAIYIEYHDAEWGKPVDDEQTLFEKVCLEGFQSGLSWLTILRKRPAFREVFHDFEPEIVASMSAVDVERLLQDARIIRHRGKIEATIRNAGALLHLHSQGTTLRELFWSFAPATPTVPVSMADVPAKTPDSVALSKSLKGAGFSFVGPTTCYAAMQAMGVVNDHLLGCHAR